MSATLFKAMVALVPACLLLAGSAVLLSRRITTWSLLQVLGAAGLVVVALTHVCEALHLFPWMGWGLQHSAGHYLDLSSALVGATLFPIGYFLHAITNGVPRLR